MIQLYAPLMHDGHSFTEVGRQVAWMLQRARLPAQVYAIKTASPDYSKQPLDVGLEVGATTGIAVAYPDDAGWLRAHENRILITVCETQPVPKAWVHACNEQSLIVVPSQWCKEQFLEAGVTVPVMVCRHGVPGRLLEMPQPGFTHIPTLLHVSSALSFPQRKGTSALIMASQKLWAEGWTFRIKLKLPKATDAFLRTLEQLGIGNQVDIVEGIVSLEELYKDVHATIQPSRAEGFGLVPLEGRLAGRPAILTGVTGHTEHLQERLDIVIPTGPLGQMDSQGVKGGWAPTIAQDKIEWAITRFLSEPSLWMRKVQSWRNSLPHGEWSWEKGLLPLQEHLRRMPHGKSIGYGWLRGTR